MKTYLKENSEKFKHHKNIIEARLLHTQFHPKNRPSKHFLFSNMSWKWLEDIFHVTIFHLARSFQDVFAKCLGRQKNITLKTSSKCLEEVFNISLARQNFAGLHHLMKFDTIKLKICPWRTIYSNSGRASKILMLITAAAQHR